MQALGVSRITQIDRNERPPLNSCFDASAAKFRFPPAHINAAIGPLLPLRRLVLNGSYVDVLVIWFAQPRVHSGESQLAPSTKA
jgi:hypothetical protein